MAGPVTAAAFKSAVATAKMAEPPQIIMEKCAVLCGKFALEASEILFHMEAFLMNNSLEVLTIETFGKFEQYIQRESTKGPINAKRKAPTGPVTKPPMPARRLIDSSSPSMMSVRKTSSFSTPDDQVSQQSRITYRDTPSPTGGVGSQPDSPFQLMGTQSQSQTQSLGYEQRADRGKVMVTMNPSLGMRETVYSSDSKPYGMRCKLETSPRDFNNVSERYRYMFTTLDTRAKALEKHFHHMQDAMCALASISPDDLSPVGLPSQDAVWVCGRICCESSEGKINKLSVVLEGSRRDSSGRRVILDLQEIPGYSLFPGQIVLVLGTNSSGRRMLAKQIVEGVVPPMSSTPPARLLEYHHGKSHQGGEPLSIFVASGPFTTEDNLDYEPFMDLLGTVLTKKPDVLILVGPFVDITQPIVESGDLVLEDKDDDNVVKSSLSASYEMVFIKRIISDGLARLFGEDQQLRTQIILVPSLLDAHHECVFPQPPFGDRDEVKSDFFEAPLGVLSLPDKERIHLMPNPCMFRVNEVLIGISSNDSLFTLSGEEISLGTQAGGRLPRLAGHLLQQRSFAPQFPPPPSALGQLDMAHAKHWQMKVCPDLLISPSKMGSMAKEIFGTLLVNPGQLVKRSTGGTYAEISVHPMKESELRDASIAGTETLNHTVHSRSCVQIIKL